MEQVARVARVTTARQARSSQMLVQEQAAVMVAPVEQAARRSQARQAMVVLVVSQAQVAMAAPASMAWVRVVATLAPQATVALAVRVELRQREPPVMVAPVEVTLRVAMVG